MGGAAVGPEEEDGAVVPEELVEGVEGIEEPDDPGADRLEVLVVEPVPAVGSAPDVDHEVAAVLADDRLESEVGSVRALVDEPVLGLPGPRPVEVELLIPVDRRPLPPAGGLGVPRVVEAGSVRNPGHPRELHPADPVREVLAADRVPDVPLAPVGAAVGGRVRQLQPVAGDGPGPHRHRPVRRQRVRVEEEADGSSRAVHDVETGLVGEPVGLRVEEPPPLPDRGGDPVEVPRLAKAPPDLGPLGDP